MKKDQINQNVNSKQFSDPSLRVVISRYATILLMPMDVLKDISLRPDWWITSIVFGIAAALIYAQSIVIKLKIFIPPQLITPNIVSVINIFSQEYFLYGFFSFLVSLLLAITTLAMGWLMHGKGNVKQVISGAMYSTFPKIIGLIFLTSLLISTAAIPTPVINIISTFNPETHEISPIRFSFISPNLPINCTIITNVTAIYEIPVEILTHARSLNLTLITEHSIIIVYTLNDTLRKYGNDLFVRYSSTRQQGSYLIKPLSLKEMTYFNITLRKNETFPLDVFVEFHIPLNMTFPHSIINEYHVPVKAECLIVYQDTRREWITSETLATLYTGRIPSLKSFNSNFFEQKISPLYKGIYTSTLFYQSVLLTIAARLIHKISWKKSGLLSALFGGISYFLINA